MVDHTSSAAHGGEDVRLSPRHPGEGTSSMCARPAARARHGQTTWADDGIGDVRRVDDVGFDPACPQPAGQPEPIATGLECNGHPADGSSCSGRLVLPASEQPQKALLVWLKLLQRVAVNARYDPGDEPTRPAHLDDRDQGAILVQSDG